MIEPAKEGIKTIIEAATINRVKRIVVTSAFITVVGNNFKKGSGSTHYTAADFP